MTADDAGALADRALARLQGASTRSRLPFTCGLSVDELLLVEETGYEPVGLVGGSSVYTVAPASRLMLPTVSREVADVSAALHEARRKAMDRLRREAGAMGADGVVGVRLTVDLESWGELRAEFVATGTAVRAHGSRGQPTPFTSNLSGRDFYALRRGGYHPVDLVMGACVWHAAALTAGRWLAIRGRNVELAEYTAALYAARELAMARMSREAAGSGARGIVGVRIEERPRAWGNRTVEFLAVGTAVTLVAAVPGGGRPAPVLSLDRPGGGTG